jgi:hypothetical protein
VTTFGRLLRLVGLNTRFIATWASETILFDQSLDASDLPSIRRRRLMAAVSSWLHPRHADSVGRLPDTPHMAFWPEV